MQIDSSYLHFCDSLSALETYTQGYSAVYYVVDSNLIAANAEIRNFVSNHNREVLSLEISEQTKNLTTLNTICDFLLEHKADRKALLVGMGGGITTDITGFAAAVYKRGIACGYVPTTILAAVDAAVGGKCGVNSGELKNMLGVIRQPEFVFYYPGLWESLPENITSQGCAELVKMQIIRNLNTLTSEYIRKGASEKNAAIFASARAKLDVVEQDETEQGLRRVLNLGHTYAHAIEYLSHEEISHGDAVAMGIVLAAETSVRLGICKNAGIVDAIKKKLTSYGLPTECPFKKEEMKAAILNDKKMEGDKIHLIAIRNFFDVIDILINPENL